MKPLIVANWKMFFTVPEAAVRAAQIDEAAESYPQVTVVVCPSFTAIESVADAMAFASVGAQDLYPADEGNFTGAVATPQVAEFCSYAIVGHSERRLLFHEDDQLIAQKMAAVLKAGITPILAVGETAQQRRAKKTKAIIAQQLRKDLAQVAAKDLAKVVIAYEPVWAISKGKARSATAASVQEVEEGFAIIQKTLYTLYGKSAGKVRLLYGGSSTAKNCAQYFAIPACAGALVGAASRDPKEFSRMIAQLAKAKGA